MHRAFLALAAALIAWAAHIGPASAACAPGTCCNENPTTGTPTCGQAAGNPLNVMSGNKFQREVDMPALPGVLGLELVRYYNSEAALDNYRGIMGRGWRLSYEAELALDGQRITVHQGDGTQTRYEKAMIQWEPGVTVYNSNEPGVPSLRAQRVAGTLEYNLTLANGNRQTFDAQGKLVRITAPTGEYVSLQRDVAGFLLRVTDPQGRFLSLRHLPPHEARTTTRFRGVQTIDTPVGRFTYSYGSAMPAGSTAKPDVLIANLVKVDLPTHYDANRKVNPLGASNDRGTTTSSVSRIYHYEDAKYPTLLTGITVQGQGSDGKAMNERIVTWGYDARGRANLSVKGSYDPKKPGPEQVTLEFHTKADGSGATVLTNSLGQTTSYSYAQINGKALLLEVRGAGCATCGPVNVRHRYDVRGRLMETTQLDAKGQPVSAEVMEYDGIDRLRGVSEVRYRNGKAGAPRMLVRYVYGPDLMNRVPTVIERPSVVPGKEHVTRIEYNDKRQPVSVTESGFSPLDEKGEPSAKGSPISRTTRYTYAEINGRSVLSSIDGPLPNGPMGTPKDSDITYYEWDKQGDFPVSVVHPMSLKETFRRDDGTGRLIEQMAIDGAILRTEYDSVGHIERTERAGQVVLRRYDALGELSAMSDAAGRSISISHDAAGRPVRISDAQGYASALTLDTEGKVMVAGLYEPQHTSPLRAAYNWYDENNRLAKQLRADGRIDTYAYDSDGRLAEHFDGDDVLHVLRRNQQDTLSAQFDLTPDGLMRVALSGRTESGERLSPAGLRDDFGRHVTVTLRDHGMKIAKYDAADKMIEVKDAAGGATEFEYDAAGRLTRKTARGAAAAPVVARFSYEGARLARIEDPAQTTSYIYDDAGRVARTTYTLLGADGKPVSTYTSATTYDDRTGQPDTQTLADGRVLRIERDAATQVAERLDLQGAWASWVSAVIAQHLPDWMQWLQRAVPQTTLAHDIRFHPFNGIEGFTQGNGITTAKTFDIAGRLTHLKVESPQASLYDVGYGYEAGPKIRNVKQNEPGKVVTTAFTYDGFGALRQDGAGPPATMLRTSLNAASAVTPAHRDELGRIVSDGRYRYTYTAEGEVETVSDSAGVLLARYRYNSFSERVSKTVYGPGQKAVTSYFLWQRDKLVAEVDAQGRITSQYVYLSEDGRAAPIAKLESRVNPENASRNERTLYIHTDHRGAPVAMTDRSRKVVWRAMVSPWGSTKVSVGDATLNLRLPGQYFDAETGLHDNFHRTYDPGSGRYLQPDPLGYPDGPDAYLYASGDPINKVDSSGLYEEDVHYYLTFFLARVAGIPEEVARTVALADQYVDDNPLTTPVIGTITPNTRALPLYHFTRERSMDVTQNTVTRINNPTSPQLENLRRPTMDDSLTPCARQQFFGEYLHAFEDTFAHRDQDNVPFFLTSTAGHGAYNHDPDQTYNVRDFQNNEMRTMRMAEEVYGQLQSFGGGATTHSWSEIQSTVLEFVRTGQEAGNAAPRWQDTCTPFNTCDKQAAAERHADELAAKARVLESKLVAFGLLDSGDLSPKTGRMAYDSSEASRRRSENLKGLTHAADPQTNQKRFEGILLPGD